MPHVNLEKNSNPKLAWLAATLVTLAAVAERAWLLFSTPLVPGINGAYYLVQARALLEQGKLGIPDLPLTFWVDAALAKLIQLVSGTSLEASIILAVKLEDSFLPALVALPVFALVRRWSLRVGGGLWLPSCAAFAVACGAPALGMVGDFQKNSLGLVWLAALLWRLHIWLEEPRARNAALAVLFLTLTGLTHIGVFGWALALAGLAMAVALWRCDRATRRKILPWLFVGGAACGLAGALVLWKFDPARVQRLANAVTHPLAYLGNDQGKRGNAPRLPQPNQFPAGQNNFRPQFPPGGDQKNFRPPNGMPGGPMLFGRFSWLSSAAFLTVAAGALAAVWFRRKTLSAGDVAVAGGCALGLIALGGPWVTGDKVMRFGLIAVGPAVVVAAFALAQIPLSKLRNSLIALIAIALVGAGIVRLKGGGRPVITLAAADELRALAGELSAPEKSLIVARHGLEWWTAWLLHTHIAHADVLQDSDWQTYDQVFFLRQKAGAQMPFGPRPGNGNFPPRNGSPGGGAFGEPVIPRNAEVTHDGECFTLALVKEPIRNSPRQAQAFRPPPGGEFP
ncbi:MAG: hypothetical protein RL380_1014 [Verrucomicrobiota bacterium]